MKRGTADLIAVVLALGLSISVIALVVGVTVAAIKNGSTASTLSDNESQVLTAAFGGMVGVLGAWVGYRAAEHRSELEEPWPNFPPPQQHQALPSWPDREKTVELPPEEEEK